LNKTNDFEPEEDPSFLFNSNVVLEDADLSKPVKKEWRHGKMITTRMKKKRQHKFKWYTLQGFLHIIYIPMLRHKTFKVSILFDEFNLYITNLFIDRGSLVCTWYIYAWTVWHI
jgi:hypothetical protein